MRRWAIGLWLGLLGAAVVGAADFTLTIATYNVENYTLANRMVRGTYRPDYPKPEDEKAALRRVIASVDADVWALQEMGGEDYVRELQRDLRREGRDYPHAAVLPAADDARRVAVLSRRPLSAVVGHDDLTCRYFDERVPVRRGLLEVRFATPGGELALFVVHFKSRFTERSDDPGAARLRGAEATAARDRVVARSGAAGDYFVVAGDFNDGPRSRAVRAFERKGPRRLAYLLPVADSRGHAWTHHYRQEDAYTRVDHILVSPALRGRVGGGAGRIIDLPETATASDHRPVVVTLAWPARD
jgi:endonuclease/exonuclease/phosphatase family metal-dependent hydrolase